MAFFTQVFKQTTKQEEVNFELFIMKRVYCSFPTFPLQWNFSTKYL